MERREIRECGSKQDVPKKTLAQVSDDDEADDEFYDCLSNEEQSAYSVGTNESPLSKPEGRQSRLADLKLIENDEPLYIPVTQDPVPKTEDQLQDDAEVMLKLGPGSGEF